ncbi:formate dehydrogenase accessory sulfurtransferase FdhD [Thalassotalea psychrophila]|uniref:Sulfur carrier protein FdhD n=1 Tax=Thalassotalea psychrophila TaxID=3065647 RepID=A0ABY9TT12_9GAMM|nr:formate dehydrogenase accessory sulfurtransferase FdhD [Colwelliaceae bacterium SQ149]
MNVQQVTRKIRTTAQTQEDTDWVVSEQAIALVYNGISHAVMMATPADLHDFALGFSLNEGIIERATDLLDFEINEQAHGIELDITLNSRQFSALKTKRRSLAGNSGCGLCGVESLAQTIKQRPSLPQSSLVSLAACKTAIEQFTDKQALKKKTGGVHGAAFCSTTTGEILLIREDVGRHNALDKLIGALAKTNSELTLSAGFILVSSRASYEMVDKTIASGIPHLVSMSAATSKAIDWAKQHQLNLIAFANSNRQVIYADNSNA